MGDVAGTPFRRRADLVMPTTEEVKALVAVDSVVSDEELFADLLLRLKQAVRELSVARESGDAARLARAQVVVDLCLDAWSMRVFARDAALGIVAGLIDPNAEGAENDSSG